MNLDFQELFLSPALEINNHHVKCDVLVFNSLYLVKLQILLVSFDFVSEHMERSPDNHISNSHFKRNIRNLPIMSLSLYHPLLLRQMVTVTWADLLIFPEMTPVCQNLHHSSAVGTGPPSRRPLWTSDCRRRQNQRQQGQICFVSSLLKYLE